MNLPLSGIETILFFIFLAIWAGFLFGGFFYGTLNEEQTRRMPLSTRLLSSLTLVIAAWIWFAVTRGTDLDKFTTLLAIGMSCGFIGDIFMAQVLNVEPHVIYGILAFGIGHIAYIIGMCAVSLPGELSTQTAIGVLIVWWIIAFVLWYLVVFRGSKRSTVIYLALPYAILLATTVAIAMNLTLINLSFLLAMVGAILFLVSDLILAAQLFNQVHFKYVGDVVWLLYGPGQMLIVFGVFLYMVIDSLPIMP